MNASIVRCRQTSHSRLPALTCRATERRETKQTYYFNGQALSFPLDVWMFSLGPRQKRYLATRTHGAVLISTVRSECPTLKVGSNRYSDSHTQTRSRRAEPQIARVCKCLNANSPSWEASFHMHRTLAFCRSQTAEQFTRLGQFVLAAAAASDVFHRPRKIIDGLLSGAKLSRPGISPDHSTGNRRIRRKRALTGNLPGAVLANPKRN